MSETDKLHLFVVVVVFIPTGIYVCNIRSTVTPAQDVYDKPSTRPPGCPV